jgi:hypothetical protein
MSNKRNHREYSNPLKLENTTLDGQWVIEDIMEEIQKFLESNENEITTNQN